MNGGLNDDPPLPGDTDWEGPEDADEPFAWSRAMRDSDSTDFVMVVEVQAVPKYDADEPNEDGCRHQYPNKRCPYCGVNE